MLKIHMKKIYKLEINKTESTGLKHLNDSKGFFEYSNDMPNIYRIIEEYYPNKKGKIWLFLVIWLLICLVIKKPNPIVTELFMRGRKIDISLFYQTTLYYYTKKY